MEIRYYHTPDGEKPIVRWLKKLNDRKARSKTLARFARIAEGNPGDVRSVGDGVLELRIDWGPGYRVYFARPEQLIVLLLCGGDKRRQQKDIERAKAYFEDYKARATPQESDDAT